MKLKNMPGNLLLGALSVLLTLFVAEAVFRVAFTGTLGFRATAAHDIWVYDRDLGWVNQPQLDTYCRDDLVGYDSRVTFDEIGIRSNDNPKIFPVDKRILIVGDSTTAGIEVDNDKTYTARLERMFLDEGYRFKFYNAGVRGYGTDQSLWNLKRLEHTIRPDYVVYMFCRNDLRDNRTIKSAEKIYGKPAYILRNGRLELVNHPVKRFDTSYYAYVNYGEDGTATIDEGYLATKSSYVTKAKMSLRSRSILYNVLEVGYNKYKSERTTTRRKDSLANGDPVLTGELTLLRKILEEMAGVNKNVIVTSHTTGQDMFAPKLREVAQAIGLPFFDLSPYFKPTGDRYDSKYDHHWNEKGHETAAFALHELLKPVLVEKEARPSATGRTGEPGE